jgi:hypothetical protein
LAHSDARDLLLVTDGKSYALDAHRVARAGRRVSVLLIGDDALEALVGQIAALTGGQVFVAAGADIQAALAMALVSMRTAAPRHRSATASELQEAGTACGGMIVEARWSTEVAGVASVADEDARVIGTLAAALALPAMDQEQATALAVSHGIVTYLTSLVLVDEAGERQSGLPAQRKVPLMASAGSAAGYVGASGSLPMAKMNLSMLRSPAARFAEDKGLVAPRWTRFLKRIATANLPLLVDEIDWNADPEALLRLDNIIAPRPVIAAIYNASAIPEVTDLADALGQPPHLVVLALLAMAQAKAHRGADRIARLILAAADARLLDAAAAALGLDRGS